MKIVKKAKSIIEGFYNSKDPGLALLDEEAEEDPAWRLGSSRSSVSGSTVVAMLETIVTDFQKEQDDADKAERAAAEELEKVRNLYIVRHADFRFL